MRPMSWESGNQLHTTAPSRGSSHPYIDVRLASSASRVRAMPRGVPVLPDVNCTKLPGASEGSASPAELHSLNARTGTGAADSNPLSDGSHRRWVAPVNAHIVPI